MLGMACTVTVDALKKARHHLGFLGVGLASQWLLMPAVAYAVARAFDLAPHVALTLITLGCSPGGTMSNAMVYLADGDTALSIALTACTNVLALGTMPLLLHLWVERTGAASDIRIPYDSVVLALALVLVPAALGVALRHYRPKLAKIGERVGAGTHTTAAQFGAQFFRRAIIRRAIRRAILTRHLSAVLGAIVILSAIVVGFAGNADVLEDRQLLPINAIGAVAAVSPIGCIFALAACALSASRGRCSRPLPRRRRGRRRVSADRRRRARDGRAEHAARARGRPTHPRRRAGRARERDGGVGGVGRARHARGGARHRRRARVGPTQERRARHLRLPPQTSSRRCRAERAAGGVA